MFRKAVRGMCNYKTARGGAAFDRLKVFEGVPAKYEKAPKLVIPHALRVVAIHHDRPVTSLGKLATTFGWKYGNVVRSLEVERLGRAKEFHQKQKEVAQRKERAIAAANQQLGAAAVKFLETYVE